MILLNNQFLTSDPIMLELYRELMEINQRNLEYMKTQEGREGPGSGFVPAPRDADHNAFMWEDMAGFREAVEAAKKSMFEKWEAAGYKTVPQRVLVYEGGLFRMYGERADHERYWWGIRTDYAYGDAIPWIPPAATVDRIRRRMENERG